MSDGRLRDTRTMARAAPCTFFKMRDPTSPSRTEVYPGFGQAISPFADADKRRYGYSHDRRPGPVRLESGLTRERLCRRPRRSRRRRNGSSYLRLQRRGTFSVKILTLRALIKN